MKHLAMAVFQTVFISFIQTNSFAQDTMYKVSGEEVDVKVVEISQDNVRYRNFSNLNGPIYVVPIRDIFMIKYENGEEDVFGVKSEPVISSNQPTLKTKNSSTNTKRNKFEIGIEGGPSLVSLRGNQILNSNHRLTIGFAGGFTFQYNFPKIVSLRTNIYFERKGSVVKYDFTDLQGNAIGTGRTYSNFEYLTLPVLAQLSFGKKFKFLFNVGPYFGFLIKQNSVNEGFGFPLNGTTDRTENYKRFDTGLSVGIGGSVTIKEKFVITLEARNNLGLYNVSELPVVDDGAILTNSTNLLIGFAYSFGRRAE